MTDGIKGDTTQSSETDPQGCGQVWSPVEKFAV
jgi:hypothetical protein